MNKKKGKQIVPGIQLASSGEATVDSRIGDVLFDIALKLEEPTDLPVDVEHVLAAIVMLSREGRLANDVELNADDESLIELLTPKVKLVFTQFGGQVGKEN